MAELRNASQMFPLVSYWVCKYRKAQPSEQSEGAAPSFIPVHTPAAVLSTSMEIVLPTGVVIRFADQVPAGYLQQLLKVCSV